MIPTLIMNYLAYDIDVCVQDKLTHTLIRNPTLSKEAYGI